MTNAESPKPTKPDDPPTEGGEDERLNRLRERSIGEAAYYRAEKRGFAPDYSLEDWLTAEHWVDFERSHSPLVKR